AGTSGGAFLLFFVALLVALRHRSRHGRAEGASGAGAGPLSADHPRNIRPGHPRSGRTPRRGPRRCGKKAATPRPPHSERPPAGSRPGRPPPVGDPVSRAAGPLVTPARAGSPSPGAPSRPPAISDVPLGPGTGEHRRARGRRESGPRIPAGPAARELEPVQQLRLLGGELLGGEQPLLVQPAQFADAPEDLFGVPAGRLRSGGPGPVRPRGLQGRRLPARPRRVPGRGGGTRG